MSLTTDTLFFGVGAGPMHKILDNIEVVTTFWLSGVSSTKLNMIHKLIMKSAFFLGGLSSSTANSFAIL